MVTRAKLGLFSLVVLVAAVAALAGGVASAGANIVCAHYTSQTNTATSVTVTFEVFEDGCAVTLTSYQSTSTGHTHQAWAGDRFDIGTHSLTVPLTCGTDNQVALYIGEVENAESDIGSWSITPQCGPPPPSVCTYTKGFYKNHLNVVAAYAPSGLGGFNLADLQGILTASPSKLPAGQGGALNLAQQALTALLNEAKGAAATSTVNTAIATALANLNITLVNHNVTSVTVNSGTNTGGLTSIIEPFNSATDCG